MLACFKNKKERKKIKRTQRAKSFLYAINEKLSSRKVSNNKNKLLSTEREKLVPLDKAAFSLARMFYACNSNIRRNKNNSASSRPETIKKRKKKKKE